MWLLLVMTQRQFILGAARKDVAGSLHAMQKASRCANLAVSKVIFIQNEVKMFVGYVAADSLLVAGHYECSSHCQRIEHFILHRHHHPSAPISITHDLVCLSVASSTTNTFSAQPYACQLKRGMTYDWDDTCSLNYRKTRLCFKAPFLC